MRAKVLSHVDVSGQHRYSWAQQQVNSATGVDSPVAGGMSGTTAINYAVEMNNALVPDNTFVDIEPKGYINNQMVWEFSFEPGIQGSGMFRHVPRWTLPGTGLEDTGVTIGRGSLADGGDTNLCVWFQDNTFAGDTAFMQFSVLSQAAGSYTPPNRFGACRIWMNPQGAPVGSGLGTLIQSYSGNTTLGPTFAITNANNVANMVMTGDSNYGVISLTGGTGPSFYPSNLVRVNALAFVRGVNDISNPQLPYPHGSINPTDINGWFTIQTNSPPTASWLTLHGNNMGGYGYEYPFGVMNFGLTGTIGVGAKAAGGIVYDLGSGSGMVDPGNGLPAGTYT